VEVGLSELERADVRKKFADSAVNLVSLGSAFEYHQTDPAEVHQHVEGTTQYADLAKDVGATGIKVRPNGLQIEAGIPEDKTLEQIGLALKECADYAAGVGIKIRLEVHGRETMRVPRMRKILDYADSDNLYLCWNCNQQDLEDGGLESNFNLVRERIEFVHMRDLSLAEYPWSQFLGLLADSGYDGYCCAEIAESPDPVRLMHYYRALFDAYRP